MKEGYRHGYAAITGRNKSSSSGSGKVISDHFYQAGGPQGHDGHCVADEEAERIIRRHLQLHLPECSIIGEELGSLDRLERGNI